ncbi:MAG: signal peptide peptidase SppA [Rhodocyclaceae bacterium]|jgi:signal peptide peptidase SppA|nr:signal peptide peptidase SppA [Rhodocyclaceae bacterium]
MRLLDIINAPWAITPEMLGEIQSIYGRHLRGDKIDLASLSAATGIAFDNQPKGYRVEDGVAVLPIDGVIAKRMNLFTKISGGTSSELVGRDFQAALADRAVQAIVLAIDSPGGTVDGTPELADLIFQARGQKPIVAVTDGMMASAAYWIGSAADQVFISSEVAVTGSIGVVTKHVDLSAAEAKQGIKTTEIFAGRYKRIASQYGPLSAEGLAYIQEAVDHAYSVFVEAVARNRGATVEDVLNRMADGRTFNGSQAVEAGLVDGVATLTAAIDRARALARPSLSIPRAGVAQATQEEPIMDLHALKENHPDLVEAIRAEALAGMDEHLATARTDGAQAERDRVASVRAQSLPGHEALIERLAADGESTGDDAARAIIAAERDLRTAAADRINTESNRAVGGSLRPEETTAKTMTRADFNDLDLPARAQTLKAGIKIVD